MPSGSRRTTSEVFACVLSVAEPKAQSQQLLRTRDRQRQCGAIQARGALERERRHRLFCRAHRVVRRPLIVAAAEIVLGDFFRICVLERFENVGQPQVRRSHFALR